MYNLTPLRSFGKIIVVFFCLLLAAQNAAAQNPVITSFSPASGGLGTRVIITGSNFSGLTGVSFGGTPSSYFYIGDSSSIYAYVGNGSTGDVIVTTTAGSASLSGFTFMPPPVITSFNPRQGYEGSAVTIKGKGFNDVYYFSFGGVQASSFQILSDSVATVIVGKGASGNIIASGNYGADSVGGFKFIGPVISSFTPTAGGDGTVVTITGINFTGATAVSFGSVPAKSFIVNSSTQITATVAAGSAGDVAVTTNYGTATRQVFGRPFISSFGPNYGGPQTVVTINGLNFTDVKAVMFGDSAAASFTIPSDTVIKAVVGYGSTGFVRVKTLTDSARGDYFYFGYQYPVIKSFSPASGKFADVITIKGSHFISATSLTFGGTEAKVFKVVSDSLILAVLGNGSSGDISVTTAGGFNSINGFQYFAAPVITSFNPAQGPAGTQVTITGGQFDKSPGKNLVYFGPVKAKVISAEKEKLIVEVPTGAGYQPISVAADSFIAVSLTPFLPTFQGGLPVFSSNSFEEEVNIENLGKSPQYVADADFDGDGKTDMVVSDGLFSKKQSIDVLRNISTAAKIEFGAPAQYRITDYTEFNALPVVTADINADGKLDLLVTDIERDKLCILKNISTIGHIKFDTLNIPLKTFSEGFADPVNSAVADFDGDGKLDVAYANFGLDLWCNVAIMRNTSGAGNISFEEPVSYDVADAYNITTGDFNHDNKPDIAVAIYINGNDMQDVSVLLNTSSPGKISFTYGGIFGYSLYQRALATVTAADLDGDDKPEIIPANTNHLPIILQNTTAAPGDYPTFNIDPYDSSSTVTRVAINNMDGDGKPDIVASGRGAGNVDNFFVYKNTSIPGALSFIKQSYSISGQSLQLLADDFDNDGRPDIITTNTAKLGLSIFRNKMGEPNIVPSGNNPVTGGVTSRVMVDSTVQTYNGSPYVQRHYTIQPENNDSTASATITLCFTQQEFDNFNAYPGHGADLPTDKNDSAGVANIRIYQYHGNSLTGSPGSYPGTGIEIDPADDSITWSDKAQCWQVTFNVTGFSGFFAGSKGSKLLPVNIISFTAFLKNGNTAALQWKTASEINSSYYTIYRSTDGIKFSIIAKVSAKSNSNSTTTYNYLDNLAAINSHVIYYQLVETDRDDKTTPTKIINLALPAGMLRVAAYPNPAKNYVTVLHSATSSASRIVMTDITGRTVKIIEVANNVTSTTINLSGLSSGVYNIKFISEGHSTSKNIKLLIAK